MYIVGHEDDCLMVTGKTVETIASRGDGTIDLNAIIELPRQCTCQPTLLELVPSTEAVFGGFGVKPVSDCGENDMHPRVWFPEVSDHIRGLRSYKALPETR